MTSTARARALTIIVLLLSYGAVGARQPAVRTSVPLPVTADQIAGPLGLDADRGHLLVSVIRLLFDAPDGLSVEDQKRRANLASLIAGAPRGKGDSVPLPLDVSIWRETLLPRAVAKEDIPGAILADRSIALLYHGLAALDDDTLGWLGPDRETLIHLRRNAAVFAAFGRSIRVRSGKVAVPGGARAERIWAAVVGADPSRPSAFVQRLMRGSGRLAWLYDTVAHLDPDRQRLVLGRTGPDAARIDRLRDLLHVFETVAPEWQAPDRPFVRPPLDPALVLSIVRPTEDGGYAGPDDRRIWEAVFREAPAEAAGSHAALPAGEPVPIDASWLVRRISLAPADVGRLRLQTFLLAQRVFADPPRDTEVLVNALRTAAAYPALALTLERIGISHPATYAAAGRAAAALNGIHSLEWRRVAIAEFQSALAIVDRAARTRGLDRRRAGELAESLFTLPIGIERGLDRAFAKWVRTALLPSLPFHADAPDPAEEAVLSACAGVKETASRGPSLEWEGRRYRVDPAFAELKRLKGVLAGQRAGLGASERNATLGSRLDSATGSAGDEKLAHEQALAETLVAIVYALHLGEPDGPAAAAVHVSRRHDFGLAGHADAAWQLPREEQGQRSRWRITGSLLGLDIALAPLALRRLDLTAMPREPTMPTSERASLTMGAALFGPVAASDRTAQEIAAAIGRGRDRVKSLSSDRAAIDAAAEDAGLSEWRREALAWTLEHEPARALDSFSLVELFWLGSPHGPSSGFDAWGAATTSLDGCLCLRMPKPSPWELWAGRPSAGYLATREADVPLRVAELLTELNVPAALAPSVLAYAMQDAIDRARPAFFDDWFAFQRAVRELPRERLVDYVAAAAADGAVAPLSPEPARP